MRLAKLEELAAEAHTHLHYGKKSRGECVVPAKKSFDRLPSDQKVKVLYSWLQLLEKEQRIKSASETAANPSSSEAQAALLDLQYYRYLGQTNLYFLCNLLEKYSQVTVGTHEDICNDFFVHKDPTFPTFEAFANQYTLLKDRMLLVPRGGFKSSIDIADCVQWALCFPAVTILILTGVYQLACDFVGELTQHFMLDEVGKDGKETIYGPRRLQDRVTGEWSQSLFQTLFFEHCVTDSKSTEFQTPAGGDDKEPTVRAASIEQNLSGWHFAVMKLDDVVTNENCLTVSRMQGVNKQISINRAMLHPYGFMDVIGTWYDEFDYYGVTIKREAAIIQEDGPAGKTIEIYLRAAWWPTEEAKKFGKIEAEMQKADWVLWFPERLSYEFLRQEKKKDPDGFAIKYLNDPRQIHKVKFPRELLLRRTIPHNQLPHQGIVVSTVDTAYSVKSWADYTVMITALIYGGRFYIVNMVRGRFNEYELPAVIAASAYKWKPKRIAIEDSVGVKWMGRELRREMDKLSISVPVEFVSLGLGSKTKSKQLKAKPVLRLLGDERMFFLNSCEGLQEMYTELEKFTGTADDDHDDIVSALSLLADQFGAYAEMESRVNFASSQFVANRQDQERHDLMYGLGRYRRFNADLSDDNPVTAFEIEKQAAQVVIPDFDPLAELF